MLLFWSILIGSAFVVGGPVVGILVLVLALMLPSEDV